MEKIILHRASLNVTLNCTLNCEMCCAFIPYFPKEKKQNYSYQYCEKCIANIFDVVDGVDIFTITGGEPLLNKDLAKIIDLCGTKRDKINTRLEIITSGTLLPSVEVVSALKRNNANVLLDDYGELSKKVDEIEAILKDNSVEYRRRKQTPDVRHCDGWFNSNNFKSNNPRSLDEAKNAFAKCFQTHVLRCNPIIDGRMYVCPIYHYMANTGFIEFDPSFSVDLLDDNISIEEKRQRYIDFLNLEVMTSCKYCNGWFEDSPKFPPAIQLKK